ncbi:MAG: hypothetical protein WC627_09220 [Legionella sp.]|jgi:hypothetical protein
METSKVKAKDQQFIEKLTRFIKISSDLRPYIGAIPASEAEAEKVLKLLADFALVSKELDPSTLTAEQEKKIKPNRELVSSVERRSISQTAKKIIVEEQTKKAKLQAQVDEFNTQVLETQKKINSLYPKIQAVALQIIRDDFFDEEVFAEFKFRQAELTAIINTLPSNLHTQPARDMVEMATQVNSAKERLIQKEKKLEAAIKEEVVKAAGQVHQMTVQDLIKSILPASVKTLGPGVTNTFALTNTDSALADLTLFNTTAIDVLPKESQVVVFKALMNQLMSIQTDGTSLNTAHKIINELAKNIEALENGTVSHLSLMAVVNSQIFGIHVDIRALLANPVKIITQLTLNLVKQGALQENIVMKLSSLEQAHALMQLEGTKLGPVNTQNALLELTNDTMSNLPLVSGVNQADAEPQGLRVSEMMDLLKAIVVIGKTAESINKDTNNQFALGSKSKQMLLTDKKSQVQLVAASKHHVDFNSSAIVPLQKTHLGLAGKPLSILKPTKPLFSGLNLSTHAQTYNDLINDLQIFKTTVESKRSADKGNYHTLYTAIQKLNKELKNLGVSFFSSPATAASFADFKSGVNEALKTAEIECAKQRGWHKLHVIIRGFIGILATLSAIPAFYILYKSGSQGFVNTFFKTPETDSVRQLRAIKVQIEEEEDNIEAVLNPM